MPSEQSTLVAVFAHPDDEFAVFPWLLHARRAGRRVCCIWLTDGAFGGQDPRRRELESVRALRALGVLDHEMTFLGSQLGIADGTLHTSLDACEQGLQAWSERARPGAAEVIVPAWEGGHQDHDAAHLAGLHLARLLHGTARQFSLYQGKGLPGPLFRVMAPLPENGLSTSLPTGIAERIGHVFRCLVFASQWKSFAGLLPFYAIRLVRRDAFVMQAAVHARTAERPHAGSLLYERRGGPDWDAFAYLTQSHRAVSPTNSPGPQIDENH